MQIKKVLTFRASSIGDALLAKHFFENIHVQYPDARCALVVAGRAAMIRDLLAAYPWIEVIQANRRSISSLWHLWRNFAHCDVVVTPGVKPGGRFGFASKIAARLLARPGGFIGFDDGQAINRYLYDTLLPYDAQKAPRLLEQDALRAAGLAIAIPDLSLTHIPQPQILQNLGLESKKYVALHLFAGADSRGMSQEKRQALINALSERYPDVPIVLTGTAVEAGLIKQLTLPRGIVIAAGKGSVQDLATLIVASAVMVSVGTGPSHMASHLKHPLVVLVVCNGMHWCGTEQFGEASGQYTHVHSCIACCGKTHASSGDLSPCIEGISLPAVLADVARYLG